MNNETGIQKHKDHEKKIKSAITAIKAILPLELYLAHKKELLSICIWKITEADGKYNGQRYWSKGARASQNAKWVHEHIYTRKELIERLLGGEDVKPVVENAIACVVTKEEHKILSCSSADGWERYKESNIKVYDAKLKQ